MESWNLESNEIFQEELNEFKNTYSNKGYSLKRVFEIYLPFWECKQNIVVEKELEPDRFSKILLELINNGKRSHAKICQFLGIEETNFCTMQLHFLIRNNLIEQNGSDYEITHEGLAFLENKKKPKTMEIEEFEYMAKEKFNFWENDITSNFFDPLKPIDKQLSDSKKGSFSGYKILQIPKTDKIEKGQGKVFIEHNNKPTYRKVVEKRNDFSEFFHTMKLDEKIFYDFADSKLECHQRNICFLGFWYENEEKPDYRKVDIRQFEKTVKEFKDYELERELSKKMTEYVLKNDVRVFKFCLKCGKNLKIKAKFCTQCGAEQEEAKL